MKISLSDYALGGYVLVKAFDRPDWLSAPPLLPEKIISLSTCFKMRFEMNWAWSLDGGRLESTSFGIPEEKFSTFYDWSTRDVSDAYGVFDDLKGAREFVKAIFPSAEQSPSIVAVGLSQHLVARFIEDQQTLEYPDWVVAILKENRSFPASGEVLGFEILSYDTGGIGHSWLCSGLQTDMHEEFSIYPNEYGLIGTLPEALQVYEWIFEDEQRGHRAEPEPYYPWLLVRYPVEGNSLKPQFEGN
jgi:hypothetical protein